MSCMCMVLASLHRPGGMLVRYSVLGMCEGMGKCRNMSSAAVGRSAHSDITTAMLLTVTRTGVVNHEVDKVAHHIERP